MPGWRVAICNAWSRPDEIGAPLDVIESRFPALFENRRMLYPRFEELSDPSRFDQGIAGFLDHIMKQNFAELVRLGEAVTGHPVVEVERVGYGGRHIPLLADSLEGIDTLIVISFDSLRSHQRASPVEIESVHSLLAGLGVPVENRFGLRPASEPDGTPSPIDADAFLDRLQLLCGVRTFDLRPHLPHFERMGDALAKLEVPARQRIDLAVPPHHFTADVRATFDALLQSKADTFAGTLLVGDATLWSSTAGGVDNLQTFWTNIVQPAHRGDHP